MKIAFNVLCIMLKILRNHIPHAFPSIISSNILKYICILLYYYFTKTNCKVIEMNNSLIYIL